MNILLVCEFNRRAAEKEDRGNHQSRNVRRFCCGSLLTQCSIIHNIISTRVNFKFRKAFRLFDTSRLFFSIFFLSCASLKFLLSSFALLPFFSRFMLLSALKFTTNKHNIHYSGVQEKARTQSIAVEPATSLQNSSSFHSPPRSVPRAVSIRLLPFLSPPLKLKAHSPSQEHEKGSWHRTIENIYCHSFLPFSLSEQSTPQQSVKENRGKSFHRKLKQRP